MNCPSEIADVLLQIVAHGIVQARSAGWSENLELATLEADHVHNLPDLIRHYDPEKLAYYWKYERLLYISRFEQLCDGETSRFTALWEQLEIFMPDVLASLPETSRYHQIMEQLVQEMAAKFKAERHH